MDAPRASDDRGRRTLERVRDVTDKGFHQARRNLCWRIVEVNKKRESIGDDRAKRTSGAAWTRMTCMLSRFALLLAIRIAHMRDAVVVVFIGRYCDDTFMSIRLHPHCARGSLRRAFYHHRGRSHPLQRKRCNQEQEKETCD